LPAVVAVGRRLPLPSLRCCANKLLDGCTGGLEGEVSNVLVALSNEPLE
jgi:hypothetical protein